MDELDDFPDRLDVDDHAAPEDDEVGPALHDALPGRFHVDSVGQVLPQHEVIHGGPLGDRIVHDVVLERAAHLGAQVSALVEIMDEYATQRSRGAASPVTIAKLLERVVDGVVCHLSADDPHFGVAAPKERPQGGDQLHLLLHAEGRALVVAHVIGVHAEGTKLVVLVVASRRIGGAESFHELRHAVLGRDQVDALGTPPPVVALGLAREVGGQGLDLRFRRTPPFHGCLEAAEGPYVRRQRPGIAFHDLRSHCVSPIVEHVHMERLVAARLKIRTQQRQSNRAQGMLGARGCRNPLSFEHRVWHCGSRGDPAHLLSPTPEPVALPQGPPAIEHGNGLHQMRQQAFAPRRGELVTSQQLILVALCPQCGISDEAGLGTRSHRKPCERIRKQGNVATVGTGAELMPVERQSRLEAQGIASSEPHRGGAGLDQFLPQRRCGDAFRKELEADGLARVAGSGHNEVTTLEVDHRDSIALVLGQAVDIDEPREDIGGRRPLERDHRQRRALVDEADTGIREVAAEPPPVRGAVPGVDDEKEILAVESVEVGIVDHTAGLVRDEGVLGLPGFEPRGVVGEGLQQESFRPRPITR